ncbi:17251_t:CDS:2 [Dentiscutata erythropus]|uniref:17251_t:CDS:1 n=1 Tax=Dentiscutata erythropus TaxID=1348616 RepID=A0A9N9EJH6_9GLOM|nr:17251_t:CDS:2 [Dentiscutata erythropus]
MTAKGETECKLDTNTKAPIVLFDEAEKVNNSAVLDALGKVLDPNVNQALKLL